jgi:hypothetical protein
MSTNPNSFAVFVESRLVKYPFMRHIYRKRRDKPYGYYSSESSHAAYLRKNKSRLIRRFKLESDPEAQAFFAWIWTIQEKLRWTNRKFADEIGVSLQTLKLWRNFHGHYPSKKSLKRLLELDRMSQICETKFVRYGITTSRSILNVRD